MMGSNTPRYNLIKQAAQTLDIELSFFSHCLSSDDSDQENGVNNNKNNDLEREIVFLRSSVDYFNANKVYPFAFRCATEDFCDDYLPISPEEYIEENERIWKRYKKRVWKICKEFQPLENPREQYAFELGNKIWGSMSVEMMQQEDDQEQEEKTSMFSAEDDNDEDEEGILDRYPFLKSAFTFESIKDDDDDEKGGLVSQGEGLLKMKKMQIEELKSFLAKVDIIRRQAMALLDELQS